MTYIVDYIKTRGSTETAAICRAMGDIRMMRGVIFGEASSDAMAGCVHSRPIRFKYFFKRFDDLRARRVVIKCRRPRQARRAYHYRPRAGRPVTSGLAADSRDVSPPLGLVGRFYTTASNGEASPPPSAAR